MTSRHEAAEDAASSVVGVIIMIAITIVFGAVVFVLLDSHADGTGVGTQGREPAPAIRIQRDETGDRLRVLSAYIGESQKADWAALTLLADKNGTEFELNNLADGIGGSAVTGTAQYIAGTTDIITAGEYLSFCATTSMVNDITYEIVHVPSNAMIAQIRLNNIAPC